LLRHWDFYWANVPPIDEAVLAQFHCIGPNQRAPTPYHELDNFIRLHAWWWAFWVSVHAPEMTGERCAVLLARCLRTFDLVAARGIRIHEHNFTAMQMESLYFWAVSLPECIGMDVWRHAARNNLESSLNRAVTEDGVHWEQSVSYHNGCIGWYGHSYLLGRMNGEPWAEAYGDRLLRMGGFVDAVITPDGKVPLLSDSDRVGNWRNGLALLRCIDPEVRFAHDAGPSYPSVWYSGGQNWTPSDPPAAPLRLGVFPQGGIGVARHPDRALGTMLLFDNGPTQAGHAHKDNLTVHFEAHAKPVLVDPGRWIYDSSAERSWVMQTPSHNTIWIEDEPLGTDERITTPRLHIIGSTDDRRLAPIQTQERDGIARLSTRFKGYTDDADAEAQRTVWMPMNDSAPWLAVLDRISAPGAHIWTNTWLLPTSEPVRAGQGGYTATLDSGLPLRFAAASSETLELRDDAKFWCPNYGEQSPARWLRFSARCTTGWRAFIFLPCESERPMPDITFDGQTLRLTIDGQTITCPA
ncbi:MAG: heparinase II/III domain-containing protein, partial [Phycisphaeraceae bacterium]